MSHEELVQVMNELKQSRGWSVIQENLKPIIEGAELKLLGDENMSPDEQGKLKKEWKLYKKFHDYPDFLVAKSLAVKNGNPNPDPYD